VPASAAFRSQRQCAGQRPVEGHRFLRREMADEVGQDAFGQAQQLVTIDAAVVLETFLDSNRDLGRKAVMIPPASQRYLIVEGILRLAVELLGVRLQDFSIPCLCIARAG